MSVILARVGTVSCQMRWRINLAGIPVYVYGSEGVHAQQTRTASSAAIHYTLLDALGSIRALVTPSGAVVRTIHYDAWGTVRHTTGTVATRLGYTGEWMGLVDGTVYLRARHYQPAIGRFLQRDSFPGIPSSPQSLHKYTYAHTNPLKHTDPSGQFIIAIPVLLAIGGVIWAGVEIGLSVYDAYTTYQTVTDPCISLWEKAGTVALFVGGVFMPGGGYASGAKAAGTSVKTVLRTVDNADEVVDATYQAQKVLKNTDTVGDAGKGLEHADDANEYVKVMDDIPCLDNSFVAGTLVKSAHGLVAIETLREGDRVWAVDPETGAVGYYPITWTTNHATEAIVAVSVTLASSVDDRDSETSIVEVIEATAAHPFWVEGRGWVDAGDLQEGDILLAADGRRLVVAGVQPAIRHVQVYNFTVDMLHTYTVGRLGTVVHNVDCDIFGVDKPFSPPLPHKAPDPTIVGDMRRMNQEGIHCGIDCSEIADRFQSLAGNKGEIIHVTHSQRKQLKLYEYGQMDFFDYHDVYTDGLYVYDPRLNPDPVLLNEWKDMILRLNPAAIIGGR